MNNFKPYDPKQPLPLLLLFEESAENPSIRSPLAKRPRYDPHLQGFSAARTSHASCCSWSCEAPDG